MAPPEQPKKPDPLVLLARASAAKRPRRVLPALILLGLVAGLAGLFIWWAWPSGEYPAVTLAAFDQVALPGETVSLTACLEPVEHFEKDAGLAGAALFFQAAAAEDHHQVPANALGYGSWECAFGAETEPLDFVVRHPGIPSRRRGVQASGRVFVWPAETCLLIVDADTALADAGPDALWTANNLDLRALPEAAAALTAAGKKRQVVYVSAGADRPTRYNKLRAWLTSGTRPGAESFPAGPVLAAGALHGEGRDRFLEHTLASLRRRYPGSGVAVTRDERLAGMFRAAGLDTFLLSETGLPADVQAVKSWGELRKLLKP